MKRMRIGLTVVAFVVAGAFARAEDRAADTPIDIGSRRELFVDRALIDRLAGGAELRLHQPVPREVVLVHDAPWEGNACAYHSLFRDGDRYRLYYRAWNLTLRDRKLVPGFESLCYAESDDGIHWRKPALGLHEFEGSKANNIVISPGMARDMKATVGGPAVFKDTNPRAAADERYKTFLVTRSPLGMLPLKSPDGIHWSTLRDQPVITAGAFDSQNLAFWDAERGAYRAYWRYFTQGVTDDKTWKPGGVRAIRTAISPDLTHWERQADLKYVDSPDEQLYENGIHPYHRAPHVLIGFPVRYVERGLGRSVPKDAGSAAAGPDRFRQWPDSLRALPELEQRMARAAASERFGSAITECLFMASRDGVTFQRWNEAFLRPGIERPGTWNYGQQFVAWHPVETKSDLPGAPNELSFYATEGYWTTKGTSLRRYTLRLDGFVSAWAPLKGGELVAKPFRFTGNRLMLNASTSAAGGIRVEIQDPAGKPIDGFRLADCAEVFGDAVERTVSWKGGDVGRLAGQAIRLRFEIKDADLYAYRFQ